MTNTYTDIIACLTGVSMALAVAATGIRANVDHRHAASMKRMEHVAQLEGRSVGHDTGIVRRETVRYVH